MEQYKMIALSTSHLSEETQNNMAFGIDCDEITAAVYPKKLGDSYIGFFVAVPDKNDWEEELNAECVNDLADCIRYAISHDADWIMFDEDVKPLDGLPVYD